MERLFSRQNKEKTKQLLKTFEYATRYRLTDFDNLTFSLAFALSS